MAEYIAIPKLGMSMVDATLVEWKFKEGDQVEKGDAVLMIETEKTQWEVEASTPGFVHIMVEEDVKAPVGRVVGMIAESKEELAELQKEPAKEIFTTVAEPSEAAESAETPPAESAPPPPAPAKAKEEKHIRISPVARKMAEEHTIDITTVTGTGPGGRIVREDIERAMEKPTPPTEVYDGKKVKTSVPLKGMRKSIAEHMHRSLSVSAQLTAMGEIDMTETVKLRSALVEQEKVIGTRITYTDIFVLAVAKALKEFPRVNSSLMENEIKIWEDINIGVAVAIEKGDDWGLIVPVVRNADQKSLAEISREVKSLVEKARSGKLMPDDVSGGTLTITNLGAFGGEWSVATPIINQPESAILGTGAITERPVVREGQIVVRSIMTYSFTIDHRVIDGALGDRFMLRVKQLLENPGLLVL